MEPIKTINYRGYTIEIHVDYDGESPREWDNLGTMVCFHRNYNLGDKHEFSDSQALIDFLKDTPCVQLPLYLIDHSGLAMNTTGFSYCDPGEWDSGQVGIIYITLADIRKEYKDIKRISAHRRASFEIRLLQEVETYNDRLTSNVYGYCTMGPDGESIDGCWGFYGDTALMISEAKGNVDYDIKHRVQEHCVQVKTWIKNHVPLQHRTPLDVGPVCI